MPNLLFLVLPIWCLIFVSSELDPVDNYLINCGSSENTTVGARVFFADQLNSTILSTPGEIFAKASSDLLVPFPFNYISPLYQTARVLNGTSEFIFPIKKRGRHWLRLHFFPFVQENRNLTSARFSVSAQNFTLLTNFQPSNASPLKEYSLNISSNQLVLVFTHAANSFAFINALEVISLPDEVIPAGAGLNTPEGSVQDLRAHALETVMRVNMGNVTIPPQNDTLGRLWFPDARFLKSSNLVQFVTKQEGLNYSAGGETENIAPPLVYESVTRLKQVDFSIRFNATWQFDVDPGFEYLIRFHFCDIVSDSSNELLFNVFVNSLIVSAHLDLKKKTSKVIYAPYHMDVVKRLVTSGDLSVTIGPSEMRNVLPDGILNGLEIMKISNSKNSLVAEILFSKTSSKSKRWVVIGSGFGAVCLVGLALASILVHRRRRRRAVIELSKYSEEPSSVLNSKTGYLIPFKAVQEATDNFCEEMIIGIGGFGKVYKGMLKDGTKVAVKRGNRHSNQGLSEFMTEIEMLSKFRHRHLVSLIGYCNEMNEMIIIYEYMANGALKNHLYGSEHLLPKLNWRQRLEICIGSARGLHYLHTGSEKAIIHRDVKSANILLDENLMAKVADFGLSKDGPEMDQTHVSTAVKGSFGYLDPEYLTRQQLTEKSDVYSFGVVMLEILSGRPVIDPSRPKETANLIEWAMKEMKRGELETILDPHIKEGLKMESLQKFAETVEKCLAECGPDRPTMGEVLWNLECALQLQGREDKRTGEGTPSTPPDDISTCTTPFSVASMGDLEGVSMSRAFSQMVKSDVKDLSDKI
ncbi:hypothetical protein DM860_003933 [Cuscuta australis]|uniref:Protein kinase domain-containing protein n=2 Tax=Cuscuta sect. Cleistogrammica TaxID=1824901 RepID=A0A328CXJ6_9ASTE|nr:hypothetical protein DM860_003933 [Cuscuta australis]